MNVSQVLLKIDLVGGGPNHSVDSYVVGENPNGRIRGHVTDYTIDQAHEQQLTEDRSLRHSAGNWQSSRLCDVYYCNLFPISKIVGKETYEDRWNIEVNRRKKN